MRCPIAQFTGPIALSILVAGAIVPSALAQTDLNQQLTIQLNSGTRSPVRDQADRLLAQGKAQEAQGNLAGAIGSWNAAIRLYQQINDMDGQGVAYSYLAAAYNRTGQAAATEDALRRRLAVSRDQRDFTGQIYANNNLGRALAPRANGSPAAGSLFMEGMDVASSVRHQRGEYLTARNMTWLANSLDQPDLNIRRYEFAFLPPDQWYANPIDFGLKLNQRGDQRLNDQRYYMATRFNGVANTLAAGENASLQFQAIDELVVAYRAMGRFDLATDVLDERLLLARSLNSPREELATLALMGEMNQDVGRVTLAQRYYEQAIVVAEQLNDSEQTSLLRERLASFAQP